MKTSAIFTLAMLMTALPALSQSAGYTNFIRQTLLGTSPPLYWDVSVPADGERASLIPVDVAGSRYELWTVKSGTPLKSYLLDSAYVSAFAPVASLTIRTEDPWPGPIPRTRADRPFEIDIQVEGMKKQACLPSMLAAALSAMATSVSGQVIGMDFASDYGVFSLGSVPGLPTNYGGLTIRHDEPDFLYIGGAANQNAAAVYRAPVFRDVDNFITGFGPASFFAEAPNIDGGLVFSPTGTMLFTRYSMNEIGQVAAGSDTMTISQPLSPLGVASSVGSLNFIPSGFSGEGDMLVVSYNTSRIFRMPFTEDNGVYTFLDATHQVQISGGPEGITHVPIGSPLFGETPHVLVSAYSANAIVAYELDADGMPIPSTSRNLVTGLTNAEGAAIDPITGDFLFSSFGGGNQVYRVTGFIPEPTTHGLFLISMAVMLRFSRRR